MALVFGHASQYLAQKTVRLRAVQSGLHDLMERWQFESKGGSDASSRFAEQVRATDKEVQELEQSWLIWSKQRKDSKSSFLVSDCSFWVLHGHSLVSDIRSWTVVHPWFLISSVAAMLTVHPDRGLSCQACEGYSVLQIGIEI